MRRFADDYEWDDSRPDPAEVVNDWQRRTFFLDFVHGLKALRQNQETEYITASQSGDYSGLIFAARMQVVQAVIEGHYDAASAMLDTLVEAEAYAAPSTPK